MKKTKKALSLLLTVVMVLAMFPAITLTFTEKAHAYGSYTKNYSVEYYYPAGTKFVKNIGLHYAESESSLWNGVRDTLSLPDDDHLHCFGYNTYYNDQTGNAFVYIDLAKGTGSRYWIGMGYTGTTNPVDALKGVGVETSEYTGYSFDDVVQETVAGKQSNWYKANTGYSAAYSPMLMSRGAVDLNKGAGGATIYVYGNYDRNFAPPIDGITVIDTNTQTMSSYSYGYNGTSGAGWYSAVACNAASGNIPNLNANSSGSQPAHLVMYYHTPCTVLNTDTLRSKYAAGVTAYNNRQSYHTTASVNALATALNNAETILSDLADGYTTAYTQTQINNAANAIGSLAYASYTVTLNANGGSGGTSSVTATYNSAMPAITPPTRTGYGFTGYYDAAVGGTKYYNANGTSARTWNKAANTTLYAQWSNGPDVLFENEFDFDSWADTVSIVNSRTPLEKDYSNNAITIRGDGSGRPQTSPWVGTNAYHMKLIPGHTYRVTATVQNVGSIANQGRLWFVQNDAASDTDTSTASTLGGVDVAAGATYQVNQTFKPTKAFVSFMLYVQPAGGAYGAHSGAMKYSDIYVQDITDLSGVVDTTATAANPKGNYNRTGPLNDFDFDTWVDTVSVIHSGIALIKDKTNDKVTMKGDGTGRPQTSPYLGSSAYMTKVIPGHTYRISYTVRNVGSVVASGRMDTMQFETYGASSIKKEIGFGMVNLQPGEKRDFYTDITMEGSYLNLMPYIQQENGAYANSGGASYDVAQTGAFEYSNMCVQDISENKFDFDGWANTISAIHTNVALTKDFTNDTLTLTGDNTGRPQTAPYHGSDAYNMRVIVGHTYTVSCTVKNVGSVAAQGRMDTMQIETIGGNYKKEIGFGMVVTQPGASRDISVIITMEYPYFNLMPYIQNTDGSYGNNSGAFQYSNIRVVDTTGGTDTVGTLPAGPTMKNYHVDGWYDQQDANGNGTGTQYTANSVIGLGTKQLFAKWAPNVYTVTLNNQSATSAGTATLYEKYNTGWYSNAAATTAASSITLPQKTGYTFGGYYTGTNGSGTPVINASGSIVAANTAITANTSIYAKWTGYPYTVAFIGGGGTGSMNNQSFVYGTAQNLNANTFTRAYTVTYKYNNGTADTSTTATYTFKNWLNTSDTTKTYNDKQSVNNLTATYNGSVTLQAQWNSASVTLPTPSRTGYSFGGWYTNEACTTSADAGGASYTPTANVTLYAKWNPNGYTVNFDGNGATSGTMNAQSASYGTAATISNNAFSRAYTVTYAGNGGAPAKASDTATYTFNGWAGSTATQGYLVNDDTHYNAAGGGAALHDYRVEGKTYVPGEEYVLEFEAWGTDGDYIISYFYGDSGYLQIAKAVNSQGTVATQSEGLIKTNITGSWTKYTVTYTLGATGDGSKTKIVRFRSGANTTYVRKVKLYQTKFVNGSSMLNLTPASGGTYNMTAQWTAPAALTLPNATRDGYTFNGWYTAAEGGSKYGEAGANYAPTQSLTMTAQWTPIDYTIKYVVDGVETTAGYTTESTETLSAPTKDGYTFKGWAISDNTGNWTETTALAAGTALAGRWGNVTLTAQFEAKTYDITYNIGEGASAADQPLSVAHDGSYTFTVTVDEAHNRPMPTVTATGATLSTSVEGNVITVNLSAVTGAVTVDVPTAVNEYTLTITGEAGFTSNDNAKTVTHGSDLTFTVTLSEGYTQNPPTVTMDGTALTDPTVDGYAYTYTITNVTSDITVSVTAQKNTYAVTFTSNDGADAPAAQTIEHGENCAFSVTPKEGYTQQPPTVTVNNVTLAAASVTDGTYNYVIEEVKEAKTVVINVPINVYTITWLDDDNTPLATTTAEHGETPVYPNAEPTKDATQQYTYTFAGWGDIVPAAGDVTYTAGYTATVNKYSVTFLNDDGSELKAAVLYDYGTPFASVEAPDDPTKEATAQYTYTFTGWDPTPETITDNVICTATYSSAVNQYSVEFVDADGRVIKAAALYDYGTSVDDINVPDDPTKEATAQYTYAFTGWSPALDTVTANVTYTATYSSTVNQYAIAFADDDGTVIKAAVNYDYGTEIADIDVPADPVKDATAQYTYTFTGWDPVLEPVTRAVTYKATYEATVNKYSVSFVDDDGTEIKAAVLYDYGTEVSGIDVPADPTKADDAEFTYTFAGWNPALDTVTANVEYKATYDATARDYLVRFLNDDGNVLQRNSLHFGETPVYVGEDPTKEATAQYTYTFAGWDKELTPITGNTDITATYTATVNKYTVTFKNDNGDQLQSGLVAYGDTPAYTEATPTKEATAQYTYTFKEWSPEVTSVTGPAEYTATYNATVNQYTVQFVNYDGEVLKSYTLDYGATPVYDGDEPVKPADAQYTYNFLSWDKEIAAVTGPATYTAVFDNITNKYAITFKNEDGTVLQQTEVLYGTLPVYEGADPTKEADAQYTYSFNGWDETVALVTGEATYTATYSSTVNQYDITFKNENGSMIVTYTLDYGMTPVYKGPALAKLSDDAQHYSFAGWNTEIVPVVGAAEYTAVFTGEAHEWNSGAVKTAATCVAEGEMLYTCTVCGREKTEPIAVDPYNHTGETRVECYVAPTEDVDGFSGDTYCADCGTLLSTGHTLRHTRGACVYCGGYHEGIWGSVVTAIHGILWIFSRFLKR